MTCICCYWGGLKHECLVSSGGSRHQLLTWSLSQEHVVWQKVAGFNAVFLSNRNKLTSEVFCDAFSVSRFSTQSCISCLILSFSDMLSHTFAFPKKQFNQTSPGTILFSFSFFSIFLQFLENSIVVIFFFFFKWKLHRFQGNTKLNEFRTELAKEF